MMGPMPRALHLLSQRPSRTGSGITVDAMARHAATAGWDQRVVVGTPASDPEPGVGGLPPARIHPLLFETGDLDFPVPGMSDVMPYRSTRFSEMTPEQIGRYREAWRRHVGAIVDSFRPDVVHAHHLWILGSIVKEIAPNVGVVSHCHATGLRQMTLCPHLASEVATGCARNDRFVVVHREHAGALASALAIPPERVHVVGAGYRDEIFHPGGRQLPARPRLAYVGKYSASKGLPWLLDAFDRLAAERPGLELHVAGSGSGVEADALRNRMRDMAPSVVLHGMLSQEDLAGLLRTCAVCVLPSFYEGLPLVLVEARASGCRLVSTDLPGVRTQLAPKLGEALETVPLPRLTGVDTPEPDDLPAFVEHLEAAISRALDRPDDPPEIDSLRTFTWGAVFERVETVWRALVAGDGGPE
jgi:glycosyltransferase involved in cell wall biosynthesis